ncbi:type IV pilin protein [Pelotomaculum propionicicum]|uniref:Type II secretion system protein G n=1 Tax=Pelotomaculum propionicicum TaxID=258475 RepID=A0A4Y7RKT3_9FIRM|nr:prepilin-type N-terminal cleavage/methylation domain-containing protein [Pelotomaculum propionicicum]NLI11366.1 prepilin-type N-terminal cleavage/methylation domain-containing protein [Peptococcaceae bacterium]TEB09585.1 Type II secretion system protein G [Pelotomaculum propionicicum]
MLKQLLRKDEGFTMVEMMVVLIIIAVLIAGGIKFYLGYIENTKVTKAKAQISTMQASLDTYYAENGAYPQDSDDAKLKVKMLNAGLVDTGVPGDAPQVAGQDCLLNVADPWSSSSYYRYHSVDGTKYYIRTGKYTVQGQENTAVYGNGSAGTSNQPTVGTPTLP